MQPLLLKVNKRFAERFRAYFGLSRMSHSVLDIAHPCIGALIGLGGFPPPWPLTIGLAGAFAGFTAVFAVNDLIDWRVDTERMRHYRRDSSSFDLDSLGYRHPIAQEKLGFGKALAWVLFWGLLSLSLAYVLNPLCCLLLLVAVGLEVCYCKLLRRTHWKALLSGVMVGAGALAGIYAYVNSPPPAYVIAFFVWTFAWEVGGRNIPNDWTDLEEDIHLQIRTLPVRYGRLLSSRISFSLMTLTVLTSLSFPFLGVVTHPWIYHLGALAAGGYFLLFPGWRWIRSQRLEAGLALFNRACLYPLAMFAVGVLSV